MRPVVIFSVHVHCLYASLHNSPEGVDITSCHQLTCRLSAELPPPLEMYPAAALGVPVHDAIPDPQTRR